MFVTFDEAGASSDRVGINSEQVLYARPSGEEATELLMTNGEKILIGHAFLDVVYMLKHGKPKEEGGYKKKGNLGFA